ncbi:helix-turn-helix domain-containing protein [Bacillus marasmi]|uniref:helix-turn-helix domain-containing protein n=1 Tax=Bacillus marasmi TaxID=1926279 RepID=UPI0011C986EA|nr:AraC family transcriptional regulator [Bacillus marasmi]
MDSIQLIINDMNEKDKLTKWLKEEFQNNTQLISNSIPLQDFQILVVEISKLLDWVFIKRLIKHNPNFIIFPIVNEQLLHTAPLTLELELPYFFTKPIKKNIFIRKINQAIVTQTSLLNNTQIQDSVIPHHEYEDHEALQELFLRRLLRGDVKSEHEIIDSGLFNSSKMIPNTVCFIQGFVKESNREELGGWQAPQVIQQCFEKHFAKLEGKIFFVPYRKHLLMLLRVPSGYASPRLWKQGEEIVLHVIEELQKEYGIYLFIGVGCIYNEPQYLHNSYIEAKTARRTPPYERLELRYFDETAKEPQILKSIDYISNHFADEITCTKVAAHINFSPTYFSRLFKKETGRSYVEYVSFVRLQRAIALIRHSDSTLEQIAEELGFNTPNYFSNTFKKYVGLTPSEYRATKEILFY